MRAFWVRKWVRPGLLVGLAFSQGCQHTAKQWADPRELPPRQAIVQPSSSSGTRPVAGADSARPKLDSAKMAGLEGGFDDAPDAARPAAATRTTVRCAATVVGQAGNKVVPALASMSPDTVARAVKKEAVKKLPDSLPAAPPSTLVARTMPPAAAAAAMQPVETLQKPEADGGPPDVRPADQHKGTTADRASHARFGHAADYAWLTGELQYIHTRHAWHLRFAPADQADCYGGTVTLVGDGLTCECKSGQVVRVEGTLINPASGELRPLYWAHSLRILKSAPPTDD